MLCDSCSKRISGKLCIVYDQVYADFYQKENQSDVTPVATTCSGCLGLLQVNFLDAFVNQVAEKLKNDPFDTKTFNLCVSLPKSVHIRDKILQLWAEHKFSVKSQEFGHLKDFAKHLYRRRLEEVLGLDGDLNSDFCINLNFSHILDEADTEKILPFFNTDENGAEIHKKRRRRPDPHHDPSPISRINILNRLPDLTLPIAEQFFGPIDNFLNQETDVQETCRLEILFDRQPLFIGGRYCKFSRYVHQTPWRVEGETRSKTSVQELVQETFLPEIRCDEVKFTASGREDADVRMLGDGRPFALRFVQPRRTQNLDLQTLQKKINASTPDIEVSRLKIVSAKEFDILNKSDESKVKHYVALCYYTQERSPDQSDAVLLEKMAQLQLPLEITQKTPARVLHRRPLLDRKRKIYQLQMQPVDEHHFQLKLATEAGTYVKEFVHGDFGRTRPSMGALLGVSVEILELDVEKVDFDWPQI